MLCELLVACVVRGSAALHKYSTRPWSECGAICCGLVSCVTVVLVLSLAYLALLYAVVISDLVARFVSCRVALSTALPYLLGTQYLH